MKIYLPNHISWKIMKITFGQIVLILFFTGMSYANPSIGQILLERRVDFTIQNSNLKTALTQLEKQTNYRFVYRNSLVQKEAQVSIAATNEKIGDILTRILVPRGIAFEVISNRIVLSKINKTEPVTVSNNSASAIVEPVAITVAGKVTDSRGEPLIGVSVSEQGTSSGTVTNQNGNYSIAVATNNSVLVFQYIGYETKTETVGSRTNINVVLQTQTNALDEVVVTALGIKKESKKLGYATSTVKVDEITQNRTTNVMTALEGKIAGLDIAPPTAGAGASNRIRLRGQSGFSGQTNSPLIVINGLPMDQDARSAAGGTPAIDQGDNLQQVNADDIESMTVLKGATAAALYGSRASNGAIIITTKSGAKNSKFGVEYSSNFAASQALDFTNYQTEYGTGTNGKRPTSQAEAQSMGNLAWGAKYDGVLTPQYDGVSRPYLPDVNRMTEFYNTGTSFQNTLALSGGNASTSFRASFSNMDAKGISPDNNYHKKIFNLGLNSKINDKLSFQTNINYSHEVNNNPPLVGAQGVGYSSFLNRTPLTLSNDVLKSSVIAADGAQLATNPFPALLTNPYFLIGRMFNYTNRDRFLGTVTARYDIAKWLYLQGRVNADFAIIGNENNFPHGVTKMRNDANTGWAGTYNESSSFNRQMNMDFLLGTSHKIGDFSIDASIGGNMYTVNNSTNNQGVTDFTVKNLYTIGNGITKTQSYGISRSTVNSVYGFADFGYKNLLYLNVTDRSDYFSVLTPPSAVVANPKNSFNYPSVSASFIFSELLPTMSWLNYGKLRASYASVGNANGVAPFSSQLTYAIASQPFGNYPIGTIANGSNPNPNIAPYQIIEKEIGLELKTLNSRLNFDIAYYDKRTNNQIISVDLSPASGYSSTNINIAKLKNTGLEVAIDGTPVKTKNFAWNISGNAAYNTSKVLELNGGQTRQLVLYFNGTGNEFLGNLTYDVGKEMNQLVSNTYLRNANGQIMLNSSGRLLPSAPVNFGSANAKVIGGISNTFRYKTLNLLVQVDGKFGGKVFSSTALNGLRSGMSQASLVGRDGVVFDGVLPNGTKNNISVSPAIFYADYRTQQIADPFVFSSDFIKLRNITLTYDLTSLMSKNAKFVKGLSVSAFCRNVAVLMKRIPDVDPEAFASSGDTRLGYEQHTEPTTRTFGLNLNVKF